MGESGTIATEFSSKGPPRKLPYTWPEYASRESNSCVKQLPLGLDCRRLNGLTRVSGSVAPRCFERKHSGEEPRRSEKSKNVRFTQIGANGYKRRTGIEIIMKLKSQPSYRARLDREMYVLIAIELIVGVLFVMLFGIAEIARDLSRHSCQSSPDGDDDDDGVSVNATGSRRPTNAESTRGQCRHRRANSSHK
jgi:hypothetical protein